MPNANYAQYGFNGGEISPRMEMRDDVDSRKLGMDLLRNWKVHLQGPIETSPGLQFAASLDGSFGRIFPFYVTTFTSYVVVITDDKVTVTDQNGYLEDDNLVTNGDFLEGSLGWSVDVIGAGAVVFVGAAASLEPGPTGAQYAELYQGLTVVPGESHHVHIQTALEAGPVEITIGSTEGGNDILDTTTFVGPQIIHISDVISPTADMWIHMRAPGGTEGRRLSSVAVINHESEPTIIQFDSPWSTATDVYELQVMIAPGTLDMYMVNGNVPAYVLSYNKFSRVWSFEEKVFTNPPTEWGAGNYPSTLTFHQGRLYLGGTSEEPENFWASRPGSYTGSTATFNWEKYTDFRTKGTAADATAVNADHAINFTIDRRGDIRWMMSSKNLVIGTENAELIITATDGVIIPGDIESTVQSTYGSAISMAALVGNDILFISPDRGKIRTMGFEWTREQWTARDITFPAEHISSNGNWFRDIVYEANPQSTIIAPTNTGEIVACAYDPENQRGGFYHRSTDGYIHSACTLPFVGRDELWVLVDRSNGGGTLNLERVPGQGNTKLDSYIEMNEAVPTDTWSGADHLSNRECQLIADGAVHPNVTVGGDGSFSTEYPVSSVKIGLQLLSEASTMSLGTVVQYKGTARPMTKRWSKLFARIVSSYKPLINGYRPPTRHPATPMGAVEPPATETVKITNLGWDLDGRVSIVQDLPLPTEVAGIFGELNQEQIG